MISMEQVIEHCTLCDLKGDTYAFPRVHGGTGPKVMFIGEAPGKEEAKQHLAFVGRAGKLLDKWIEHLGIQHYMITNVVRHRPFDSNNKDYPPYPDELKACFPYLLSEISIFQPDYIITLGATSTRQVLDTFSPNTRLIDIVDFYVGGKVYARYENDSKFKSKGIPFFHPSYLLHRPNFPIQPYLDKLKLMVK